MSARYLGGIVSRDPLTLNPAAGNAANGVFTLEQYMQAVKNATWPGFDPYFKQTTLLLHGNGTNGAQNNTFLDSSTNNFTITRNGNTTQGTFSPFSLAAGEWSNYFDGTGDNLTVANNAAFQLGSGDFTIEFWAYFNSVAVGLTPLSMWATNQYQFSFYTSATGVLSYYLSSNGTSWGVANGVSCGSISAHTWTHVALVRNGSTFTPYINGVAGTTTTSSATLHSSTAVVSVGSGSSIDYFNGYLSNVRIVKGTAVYTGAFTPSTTPLTAITNTSLLTCQSNRFVDNSTNAFAITRNGDVKVTPFSPFVPSAAYSAGTNGGSGYFDGTGDYLSIADNVAFEPGTGNFSLQGWVYHTTAAGSLNMFFEQAGGGLALYRNSSGKLELAQAGVAALATSTNNMPVNAWTYVEASRSGTSLKLFINGAEEASVTNSTNLAGTASVGIGGGVPPAASNSFTGYLSSWRLLKGAVDNTSAYTPPTAPLTNITNTSLLLNFTNAGIIDNTGKNNLETVGNAQIDTAVKKFGTGSMKFDGTGDYLQAPSNPDFLFFTGDMTIEAWVYFNSVASATFANTSGVTSGFYWQYFSSQLQFGRAGGGTNIGSSWSPSANIWYHIATVRSGNTVTHYVNGASIGSGTFTDSISATTVLQVGTGGAGSLNGYIDDLRITKGVARYTANFTPQTSQWQDQ